MTKLPSRIASFAFLAGFLVACGSSSSSSSDDSFTPPDGPQIGSTGLYLPQAVKVDAMPAPTKGANGPKITAITARKTGPHAFAVDVAVENEPDDVAVTAYLDFGADGIYAAPLSPFSDSSSASNGNGNYGQQCKDLMAKQGKECTDACIAACDCLSCGDSSVENNQKLGCATTCSANVDSGAIKGPPYNGSEKKLADFAYNGDPDSGLPGTASQTGCNATKCTSAAASSGGGTNGGRSVATWTVMFETPQVPQATPMFTPQVATTDTVEVSPAAAPAKVAICAPGVIGCR